jgi:hypothetical protein
MKKLIVLAIASVNLVVGLHVTHATVTNVAMVANIALTGVKQSGNSVSTVRVTSRDIISALNASGQFNFGKGAQLVLVSTEDQLPVFRVREKSGTNTNTTDISSFLTLSEDGEIHTSNNAGSYTFQIFGFDDHAGVRFNVWGVTTLRRGRIVGPGIGPLSRVKSASAQVTGDGTVGGAGAVLRGTITAGSARSEVDPD